ncbi:MAG: large conductance mechanosensitive channel protein MscL [Methanocella sp.]
MGIISEFKLFLEEYKVVGLAVAFIMGAAVTALVTSLVSDIIMPLINPILSAGGSDWKNASLDIGSKVSVKYGSFLGQLINFIIIAFIVFMIAKLALGEKKVAKK